MTSSLGRHAGAPSRPTVTLRTSDRPALVPRARLRLDRHENRPLLLYPERCLLLNATAFEVLRLCDGSRTVAEILEQLSASHAHCHALPEDVSDFLTVMVEKRLVVLAGTAEG